MKRNALYYANRKKYYQSWSKRTHDAAFVMGWQDKRSPQWEHRIIHDRDWHTKPLDKEIIS